MSQGVSDDFGRNEVILITCDRGIYGVYNCIQTSKMAVTSEEVFECSEKYDKNITY